MPNQLNFPNKIPNALNQRPERFAVSDTDLFQVGIKPIWFGTNARDRIEFWIYNADGTIAGHITLDANDTALTVTTVVDNTGAYEYVNLDMGDICRRMGLEQGRYALVANFFRDEVGTEDGNQMFITAISPDRTEVQLKPVSIDQPITKQMYEWVVPSVPKTAAQGLLDQVFGSTDDKTNAVTADLVDADVELITYIAPKLQFAGVSVTYQQLINGMLPAIHARALDLMAADTENINIQNADLEAYIGQAVSDVTTQFVSAGAIDPRLTIF